jgi:hypothetical protein
MYEKSLNELKKYWESIKIKLDKIKNFEVLEDNYGHLSEHKDKNAKKLHEEILKLSESNSEIYGWLESYRVIDKYGYLRSDYSEISINKFFFDEEHKIEEKKLAKSQFELNKTLRVSSYGSFLLTLALVILGFFQLYVNSELVNTNNKLVELSQDQLLKQFEPNLHIRLISSKKPNFGNSVLAHNDSDYFSLKMSERTKYQQIDGKFKTENSWMIPIEFTIYNLKETPVVFEKIYLHNSCDLSNKPQEIKSYSIDRRIIPSENPLIIDLYASVSMFPDLEIPENWGVSPGYCNITFEFIFDSFSINRTERVRLNKY